MPVLEALAPAAAEQQVQGGSDIVVIPYSSVMESDGRADVRSQECLYD
jgi:hypothetical protein